VPVKPAVVITDAVKWRSGNVKSYAYVLCMLGLTAYVFVQQAQRTLLEIRLCSWMDGIVTSRSPLHTHCCVHVSRRAVSLASCVVFGLECSRPAFVSNVTLTGAANCSFDRVQAINQDASTVNKPACTCGNSLTNINRYSTLRLKTKEYCPFRDKTGYLNWVDVARACLNSSVCLDYVDAVFDNNQYPSYLGAQLYAHAPLDCKNQATPDAQKTCLRDLMENVAVVAATENGAAGMSTNNHIRLEAVCVSL
jgi:hypothetical protein